MYLCIEKNRFKAQVCERRTYIGIKLHDCCENFDRFICLVMYLQVKCPTIGLILDQGRRRENSVLILSKGNQRNGFLTKAKGWVGHWNQEINCIKFDQGITL